MTYCCVSGALCHPLLCILLSRQRPFGGKLRARGLLQNGRCDRHGGRQAAAAAAVVGSR